MANPFENPTPPQESEEERLKRVHGDWLKRTEAKRAMEAGEKAVASAEKAVGELTEEEIEAGLERARKGREKRENYPGASPSK